MNTASSFASRRFRVQSDLVAVPLLLVSRAGRVRQANLAFHELAAELSQWIDVTRITGAHLGTLSPALARYGGDTPLPSALPLEIGPRTVEVSTRRAGRGWTLTLRDVTELSRFRGLMSGPLADVSRSLGGAVHALEAASSGLSSATDETQRRVEAVGSYAAAFGARVDEVARAAEETRRSVNEEMSQAIGAAEETRERADVATALSARLAERATVASEYVTRIVRVMRATSMVAFNARIEAHRLGEDASEFGTIADEVKRLALSSSDTCNAINGLLTEISAAAPESSTIASEIAAVVDDMEEVVTEIAVVVAGQTGRLRSISDELGAPDDSIASRVSAAAREAERSTAQVAALEVIAQEIRAAADALHAAVVQCGGAT